MIDRMDATRLLVEKLDREPVVASLGNPATDLAGAKDRDLNLYMWNAMGLAPSVGLGLAMALPDSRVIVLDGDGSLLMNLGTLATETVVNPPNLVHIVWDNKMWELTGQQPTATAYRTDLGAVARGCGFESVARCETLPDFEEALDNALSSQGPHFLHVMCDDANHEAHIPGSPTYIKHRFMNALGVQY